MKSSIETSSATVNRYIQNNQPFAIISNEGSEEAHLLSGDVHAYKNLADIPRIPHNPDNGFRYDTLSVIPFSQAREAGLEAKEDECTIRCMTIREQTRLDVSDLLNTLPQEEIYTEDKIQYSETEEEYARIVRRVIEEQIEEGNLCNCVISTSAHCTIAEMSPRKALSIFRKILKNEFGAYMTFFFYDGERYHIGASPEKQLTVDHGEVHMNPISGTFRKENEKIDREKFIEFLNNPKERNELFMCLDEELKQMAQMCEKGGIIVGPLLKEMSKLVHTEYELIGKSEKDIIDLLRTSLHAPTVTGSPRQAAHENIANMESTSREYYAGTLALIGHHEDGTEFLDSSIMIRTMNVLPNGLVHMRVGASIVRDSIPEEESKECRAKLAGICSALVVNNPEKVVPQLPLIMDEEVQQILEERNMGLNRFLIENQEGKDLSVEELKGKSITIIDNEDHFSYQLSHMATAMGANPRVISYEEYDPQSCEADIVIVGPGPGNPLDETSAKMQKVEEITNELRRQKKSFLSVCLGHQILCKQLGFSLQKKEEPLQGVQREINFFGELQKVGQYNTFTAVHDKYVLEDIACDEESNEIHAIRGEHFAGLQFHPESIFTENGFDILMQELRHLSYKGDYTNYYTNSIGSLDIGLAKTIQPEHTCGTATFRLNRLETISSEAARILVQRKSRLDLGSVTHLTPEAAYELAQCQSLGTYGSCQFIEPLILPSITTMTPEVAAALSHHPHLLLQIEHLDEELAAAFLHNGEYRRICFLYLQTIDPQAIALKRQKKTAVEFQFETPSEEVRQLLLRNNVPDDVYMYL